MVAGAGVAAGLGVVAGPTVVAPGEKPATVPAATFTTTFLGVVHHNPLHRTNAFVAGDQVGVVRKGVVLVAYEPDAVPVADTPAFCRHTANGAGKLTLGAFRANADNIEATPSAAPVPGGMFRRVFASEGLVELELAGTVN